MDATTMRAVVAYIAELRRDRDYHRTVERTPRDPKEDAIHNRSQRHISGDDGFDSNGTGKNRYNL